MDRKLLVFTVLACFSLSQQVPTIFFGEKNEEGGRLHGGRNATEEEFPWMVYLESRIEDSHFLTCGGFVVSRNYVLTAAHCVCSNATLKTCADPKDIRGKVGVVNLTKGKRIKFNEVIVHKDYDEDVNADIALLKFKDPLKVGKKGERKICLADKGATFARGQPVIQMGWGQLENDSDSDAIILQTTDAGILMSNAVCEWQSEEHIDPGKLCVSNSYGPKLCVTTKVEQHGSTTYVLRRVRLLQH